MIRFGLVGAGRWGMHHLQSILQEPGAELAAVAVSGDESVSRIKDETNVPVFTDWREMLAKPELNLDVIDVVTPNALHTEVAVAALEAGKHLLVEKPMATTVEDCDAILEAARRNNRIVAVGHKQRVSPLWARLKAEVDSGSIGRPMACYIRLWRRGFRQGAGGWRYDPKRVGSWILEEPVHFFDLARWYLASLGNPNAVYARSNGRRSGLDENLSALITFPNGGFASIGHSTAGSGHHQTVEVVGTEGSLRAIWSGASDSSEEPICRLELARGDAPVEIPVKDVPSEVVTLRKEIARVMRCITHGEPPAATGEDGRWAVRLCLAAQQSVDTGREILL